MSARRPYRRRYARWPRSVDNAVVAGTTGWEFKGTAWRKQSCTGSTDHHSEHWAFDLSGILYLKLIVHVPPLWRSRPGCLNQLCSLRHSLVLSTPMNSISIQSSP